MHAKADKIHRRSVAVHRQAKALHQKTEALKEDRRRAAQSSKGIARPPRVGSPTSQTKRGHPVLSSTIGAPPRSKLPFSVVGIGASAGGYEAFRTFLSKLDKDTGMAFVFVQHLDPTHESHLPNLLKTASPVPVTAIEHGMRVEPNHLYVIPSNATVTLSGGRLRLTARLSMRGVSMPVDILFRSLALEQENRAIGVVLSGAGTDGTLGLEEIKGQGGITFAQDQGTAKHFGMPGSAIAAGLIDFVLAPEAIAEELSRLARHPYVGFRTGAVALPPVPQDAVEVETLQRDGSEELRTLFMLLRRRTGVDFSLYKPGTLNRRIMRRMVLHKIAELKDYVRFLQEEPGELDALFNDLLISVTGFFRDPPVFRVLQTRILPRLLRGRGKDVPLRIWSCGCSTGEEAYSLAITVAEFLEKQHSQVRVQIFASDLNARGIEQARAAIYHENILLDVSPERLRRYFTKVDGFYHVNKAVRDMCVFARQNIVVDAPFSNIDLISCRNVLIYLTPVLQKRVLPIFHYALKPHGFLVLGNSETPGEASELFQLVDKKHKIYTRKSSAYRPVLEVGRFAAREHTPSRPPTETVKDPLTTADLQREVDRVILTRYCPAGVVVNAHMEVAQFRGQTGCYLEHHPGAASLNLLKMVRQELALDVRRALSKAIQTGERVEQRGVELRGPEGPSTQVTITVQPLGLGAEAERYFLVLFNETAAEHLVGPPGAKRGVHGRRAESRQIAKLKEELSSTRESLQAIIEEQEATNEELKSANEEIHSSNEELQSTNEELETAREELQSTNEELTTLNEELRERNSELGLLNNDLTNLLNNIHVAVMILGADFKIRRFTAKAEKIFNLIPTDVGRRFTDLNRNIRVPDLDETISSVIEKLTPIEREVQDKEGRWYSLRIRPYRTQESRIEGVVLTLAEIDEVMQAVKRCMAIVRHPIVALNGDMTVNWANDAFYRLFQLSPEETESRHLFEVGDGQLNIASLLTLLDDVLPNRQEVKDFTFEHAFPGIGPKRMLVNARQFKEESQGVPLLLVSIEDITEVE